MTENDRVFLEISLGLLNQGCCVRFRPGGQSMHPAIKDGEAVLVEPVKPAEVHKGDVILYRFERGVIAHRVKRIKRSDSGTFFITQGDSSFTEDAPVPQADLLGRVVSVERDGKLIAIAGRRARWRRALRLLALRIMKSLGLR
jgi:signal peptidase I